MDLNSINRDPARLRTWVAYFVRMLQHRWWIYLDMLRRNSYTVYYRVFDTTISNGVGLACVCATKRMNSKDMRSHFVSYSSFVHGSMQCMYSYSYDCHFLCATFSVFVFLQITAAIAAYACVIRTMRREKKMNIFPLPLRMN